MRFPTTMGINGFAYKFNALNYINKAERLLENTNAKYHSSCHSANATKIPIEL